MSMRLRPAHLAYLGVLAASLVLLPSGSASAAFLTPEYSSTLTGSGDHLIGEATAVGVDEATHDIYVADRMYRRIEKFDAAGNFLFMFGDGVNKTTPGDICPVQPGDECGEGQSLSAGFPDLTHPTAIAVDNSDSPAAGTVYVAEGTTSGGAGTLTRFDSGGQLDFGWGGDGTIEVPFLQKIGVSPSDGTVWELNESVVEGPGGRSTEVAAYTSGGTLIRRQDQVLPAGGDGSIAVDSSSRVWWADHQAQALIEDPAIPVSQGDPRVHALGQVYPGAAREVAVNPLNSDVLVTFNESEVQVFAGDCEPKLGFCSPKESFGGGYLPQAKGLAIDGSTHAVYVAIEGGVAVFHSKAVPDVIPKPSSVGITDAVLTAHLDPLGAGAITGCEVEFGLDTGYGTTVPCDQTMPMSEAGDVTVHLSGLETETPYHFRFRASNANGTSNGTDRVVTPHWVKGLETGGATGIGPGSATLHGELNPDGEATHYYFEWGKTKQYGEVTPAPPGIVTSAPGSTEVAVPLEGLLTSSTTYHYRLVGSNSLGTSHGADHEFTTPLAEGPQIRNAVATPTGLTTADLHAEINPEFGPTAYRFQYGSDASYGRGSVVTGPIADDGSFHPVDFSLSGLTPATTYHFRVVAFNFSDWVATPDSTFTTPTPLAVGIGGGRAPVAATVPQLQSQPKPCAKKKVRRKGRCVKRHRNRKHRANRAPGRHAP
jgi:hypothetical protein